MALTSRRRSDQSPPQSTSQYQGRLLGADPKDPNLEQVPPSYTDDGQTIASSDRHFRTSSLISVACGTHHDCTDSRLESRPSFGIQPVFSPQGGKSGIKGQVLYKPVHNGSAEVSPISRLTPTSAEAGQDDQADKVEEEEQEAVLTAESEESVSAYQQPMTAAERRAEKRKARRFRLTHNQTRFLVLEFGRQAHPDAAQRERLSNEVPGLSPRQVQVWFQNRRAKLKRLSSDDRECMIQSRALPADFDMTQAMNTPLRGLSQCSTASTLSLESYGPTYKGSETHRPSTDQEIMRHRDDSGDIMPSNIDFGRSNMYTYPSSITTSANSSAATPMNKSIPFDMQAPRQVQSRSPSDLYHSSFEICVAPSSDPGQRGRAESLASPLQSSMAFSGNSFNYDNTPIPITGASSYSTQEVEPGHVHSGDGRSQDGPCITRPCTGDPLATSFHNITDDQACSSSANDSVESHYLDINFLSGITLRRSPTSHLDRSNLERCLEHHSLNDARLAASEEFNIPQTNSPYPAIFDPGCSLPRTNLAVYAWEDPETYGFNEEPDMHSLQPPLGNFDDIYRGGNLSLPECKSGRTKSFTYGTTYF